MKAKSFAYSQNITENPNTFIGGVSATISTRAILATTLGIDVSRISGFTIVGSDIECKIKGTYAIKNDAFVSNRNITYFDDRLGLVSSIGVEAFKNSTLIYGLFKNATFIDNTSFVKSGYTNVLDVLYVPNCTNLGGTTGNDLVFVYGYTVNKIYAHPSLATNNGGTPDGDLAYAISQGTTVIYVTNFDAPSQVTTLAAGTIAATTVQLNFTSPSSTNAIDYYECYANGILKNTITANGQNITGLTTATNYDVTIIAVDIFYNKSVVSNSINVTTI